jgi:hypothetical protein
MKQLRESGYDEFKEKTKKKLSLTTMRGACFRVSYRWLRYQWLGTSKPEKRTIFEAGYLNAKGNYGKQMTYLGEADKLLSQGYSTWFTNSDQLSQTTMASWGASSKHHKHGCQKVGPFKTLVGRKELDRRDIAVIIGFYGTELDDKAVNKPWGHAVAYCCKGGRPLYYDINEGEFEFASSEECGGAIEKLLASNPLYINPVSKCVINDYCFYVMTD